jgi:hypothetical protein
VIDGKIKVVGKPTFPWFCGDGFYRTLESKYPLRATEKEGPSSSMTYRRRLDMMAACGGGAGAALCKGIDAVTGTDRNTRRRHIGRVFHACDVRRSPTGWRPGGIR